MDDKEKQLEDVLNSLKGTKGPVMRAMQEAQRIYGYLPMEVQLKIADALNVPLSEVYGVATFYAQFNLVKPGQIKIGVCLGTACYVRGSGDLMSKFSELLKINAGETTVDGRYTLEATRCVGCCGLAPVVTVNGEVYGKLAPNDVQGIIDKYAE